MDTRRYEELCGLDKSQLIELVLANGMPARFHS